MSQDDSFLKSDQIGGLLEELVRELEHLRISYDQYFLGLTREEPFQQRKSVQSMIRRVSALVVRNSGMKFKLQQTVARYNSFATYWDRILREIEEGRYKRHLFKAKIHEADRDTGKKPKAQAPSSGNKSLDALYTAYEKALSQTGKGSGAPDRAKFDATIAEQAKKIKAAHPGKRISFRVVREGSKVTIKAKAKKGGD